MRGAGRPQGTSRVVTTRRLAADLHPAWSPDGGKIVFARKTGPENFDIFVMDADESNLGRLTRSPRGVLNVAPDW